MMEPPAHFGVVERALWHELEPGLRAAGALTHPLSPPIFAAFVLYTAEARRYQRVANATDVEAEHDAALEVASNARRHAAEAWASLVGDGEPPL
ncbi:MAG: hypothetical protein K1Y01_21265 [Vicinamibacteria bacterium]|nr:hypothetical protein [Vicinamibacteria bacterium]